MKGGEIVGKKSTSKKMNMQYSAHLSNITELNESFDKGLMRVAYTGNNRNRSRITKASFEQALPSLAYVPIVANYSVKNDDIGGHDSAYETNKDGNLVEYNVTTPVGLVPENFKWEWEDVTEKDGTRKNYLTVECLLWKRQAAYEHIKKNGITDQSMEISVSKGEFADDGYYDIQEFSFTALCLLGSGSEPCFESAALHTYSNQEFAEQYTEMYKEFKLLFSAQFPDAGTDIEGQNFEEGGNGTLSKLDELIKLYNVTAEDITFEIEGLSNEELEAAFKEAFEKEPESTPVPSEGEDFALSSQFQESLYEAMSSKKIESEYGAYDRYSVVDYDTAASEVYAYDRKDYRLYGFSFSVAGDKITVDFKSSKRKKYAIVDYTEGDADFTLEAFATPIIEDAKAAVKKEYEDKVAEFEATEAELNTLREFKKNAEDAELNAKKDEILGAAEYSVLADNEEFKKLVEDKESYSLDDLQVKADVIFAKHVKTTKTFSMVEEPEVKQNKVQFNLGDTNNDYKPYGDLFD